MSKPVNPEEVDSATKGSDVPRKLLLGLVLLVFCWYGYQHFDEFKSIRFVSGRAALAAGLLLLSTILVSSVQSISFFRIYGIKLGLGEAIGFTTIGSVGNLIAPGKTGTFSNAIYLKRVHKLNYSSYVGSLAATYFVTISVNCFLGALALALTDQATGIHSTSVILLFTGALLALVALFALPNIKTSTSSRFLAFFFNALNSCRTLRKHPVHLLIQFACVFSNAILQAGIIIFTMSAIGSSISFNASIFIGVAASLSSIVAVTPGNLGLREIFSLLSGQLVAINGTMLIAASLLERAILFVCAGSLAFIFGRSLLTRLFTKPGLSSEA